MQNFDKFNDKDAIQWTFTILYAMTTRDLSRISYSIPDFIWPNLFLISYFEMQSFDDKRHSFDDKRHSFDGVVDNLYCEQKLIQ